MATTTLDTRDVLSNWGVLNLSILAKHYGSFFINWKAMGALIELWHPHTHTFLFPSHEASILLEEVDLFCGFRTRKADIELMATMPRKVTVQEVLGSFMKDPKEIVKMKTDGGINIQKLAAWVTKALEEAKKNKSEVELLMRGYVICLAGGILFPTRDDVMSEEQLSAVSGIWEGKWITPAILAFLYSGLTAASKGWPAYGSMFVLSCWVDLHFRFISVDLPSIRTSFYFKKSPLSQMPNMVGLTGTVLLRTSEVKTREDWRAYLLKLPLELFNGRPKPFLQCSFRVRFTFGIELQLIGASEVVLYNPHRCLVQLGLPRAILESPPMLTSIRKRIHGYEDEPATIMAHWRVALLRQPIDDVIENIDHVKLHVASLQKVRG